MKRAHSLSLCGVLAVIACSVSCKRGGSSAPSDDLSLLPKESEILVGANVGRMRSTPMWKKLLDLRDTSAQGKKDIEEFTAKCGLDPFKQIESIAMALPQRGVETGDFAVVVRGQFDEAKLVSCASEQAKKTGSEVKTTEYGGKKLYSDPSQGKGLAALLDPKTAIVGSEAWIKKTIDLAAGKAAGASAKENADLMAVVKRTKTNEALWGAGIVPQTMRDQLKADPSLSVASTMKSVFGSVDFASGLTLNVNVETGNEAEAKAIAEKLANQIKEVKANPQVLVLGMSSFLDAVKTEAKGSTFTTSMNLAQPQVDDLIARLQGLLKGFGAALGGGGMGGPGMGGPPPGMGGPPPGMGGPPPGAGEPPPPPAHVPPSGGRSKKGK